MSVFYNILSLIFGIIALVIPLTAIFNNKLKNKYILSIISFSSYGVSFLSQLLEIKNRVNINDFSAIMDTIDVVIMALSILFFLTIILNIIIYLNQLKKIN